MELATKHHMVIQEIYTGSENFTQTWFAWFATFWNSAWEKKPKNQNINKKKVILGSQNNSGESYFKY